MIPGYDISAIQSETPNLAGASFVIIKATEGRTYVSPRQHAQAAHARGLGLQVGFYHFLWPGNIAQQAAWFVEQCASITGDILACDWETTEVGTHATGAEKDAFLAEVKRLRPGHKVILYCNVDYWLNHDTTSDAGDGLWIAAPSSLAGHPPIKAPWVIQQTGESRGMDTNVAQFSSLSAMRAWATGHPSTNPGPVPVPAPKPPSEYTVKEGDTLDSIARAHHTTWPVLASINHLANPNMIYPGQVLRLQ